MHVLKAVELTKIYGGTHGSAAVRALDSFNLLVKAGEFVGIMGPSGSGKTTILQILGTIDVPTSGRVFLGEREITGLKGKELAVFRRKHMGFIFQDFNLLDALTLKENIILPLVLEGHPVAEIEARLEALSRRLDIAKVLSRHPYEVSGGEKQRAAAGRALIHRPDLVLADEPTGNLDSRSARALMDALDGLNREEGATMVMVTHDPVTASFCSRILFIKDGRLVTELRRGKDRARFFQQILDTQAAIGGDGHDPA
ncbi:MAG: ABC transporter ATP-binding protein [Bacillota bacterium]